MSHQYGLVGSLLGNSFSKNFFENKFKQSNLPYSYNLYELSNINECHRFIKEKNFDGLNITIPYKQSVLPCLDILDKSAQIVGAVNVIKNKNNSLIGYNTDYPAFKTTLKKWIGDNPLSALVLGTGGASKAVIAALNDLQIEYQQVSRTVSNHSIGYKDLKNDPFFLKKFKLIVNTTPIGMYPTTASKPDIPYELLTPSHFLYDLIYSPEETQFLKQAKVAKSTIKNGMEMLYLQAALTWNIWNHK